MGKTTVVRRLVELLREAGVPVSGFTTEELRAGGRRVGFAVEGISGERGVLAHVDFSGPPRVGKYGVNVAAFERTALPAMKPPGPDVVVVIDEVGKMELSSTAFRRALLDLFGEQIDIVATVHAHRHEFTDALKRRPDLEVMRVTEGNRNALPEGLVARLRR